MQRDVRGHILKLSTDLFHVFYLQLQFLYEDCAGVVTRLTNVTILHSCQTDRTTLKLENERARPETLVHEYDLNLLEDDPKIATQGTCEQLALTTASEISQIDTISPYPSNEVFTERDRVDYCTDVEKLISSTQKLRGTQWHISDNHPASSNPCVTLPDSGTDGVAVECDAIPVQSSNDSGLDAIECKAAFPSAQQRGYQMAFAEHQSSYHAHHVSVDAVSLQLDMGREQNLSPLRTCEVSRSKVGTGSQLDEQIPHIESELTDEECGIALLSAPQTGTTPVNMTHDSAAPSPARQPATKQHNIWKVGGQFRLEERGGKFQSSEYLDVEVHIGSEKYRTWLAGASDLVVPGGRPSLHCSVQSYPKSSHAMFFESMFDFFSPRAYENMNDRVRKHFLCRMDTLRESALNRSTYGHRPFQLFDDDDDDSHLYQGFAEQVCGIESDPNSARRNGLSQLNTPDGCNVDVLRSPKKCTELAHIGSGRYSPVCCTRPDENPVSLCHEQLQKVPPRLQICGTAHSFLDGLSLADILGGHATSPADLISCSIGTDIEGVSGRHSDFVCSSGLSDHECDNDRNQSTRLPNLSVKLASLTLPECTSQYQLEESGSMAVGCDTVSLENGRTGSIMLDASRSASVGAIGHSAYFLLHFFSSKIVNNIHSRGANIGLTAISLSETCSQNNLSRDNAAKCFFQCLILVGSGFVDAAQDLSVAYGEIFIRPGSK